MKVRLVGIVRTLLLEKIAHSSFSETTKEEVMSSLDPVKSVRESCRYVYENAKSVSISEEAVERVAVEWNSSNINSLKESISWDADHWHYCRDAATFGPLTCQYIFVLDSLNFCFWPTEGFEYEQLALGLKVVLEADPTAFDADRLSTITEETLDSWFPGWKLPNVRERVLRLRELGQALLDDFGGLAQNLVQKADRSAARLVQLLLRYLPGFRDTSIYRGVYVHFYKRAQILVGDLWAAYGIRDDKLKGKEQQSIYQFYDMEALTMFADYRVPQILRSLGIFIYSNELSAKIDARDEIQCGCEEEIEIRACTIIAVEMLHHALCRLGVNNIIEIEIDWLLWQQGEKIKDDIAPHHRTLTIFY